MQFRRCTAVRANASSPVKVLSLTAALFVSSLCTSAANAFDVTPVVSFDLGRYMGTWHEIASIPQFFQRKCVRDTKASYSTASDSLIRVDNVCTREDGARERASGRARAGDPNVASKLEVTFLELFGEYRFWVAADYWVIALDPNYRWAVVGHPSRRYGWILAREPLLPTVAVAEIIGRIKSQGYDACDFLVTPQTGGLSLRRPLCNTIP
jgi:apolipoprotein D and lipocalin family protein